MNEKSVKEIQQAIDEGLVELPDIEFHYDVFWGLEKGASEKLLNWGDSIRKAQQALTSQKCQERMERIEEMMKKEGE